MNKWVYNTTLLKWTNEDCKCSRLHFTYGTVKIRSLHLLNFYQSDTCWKVSVKYRRFCFYFTTLIRASKWGKWGPKTFLQMHLLLREQIYFHKISSRTWYSPPVMCPSTCLGWHLVSSHHRSWKGPVLSSLRL